MRYGSVCSGIGAATCAWHPLGWEPAWFAEIEPFPSAVLAHRWPGVPNLGDFTAIGAEHGPVDLLVGGTPCQSFSVAGLRGGLADDRGNLALQFLRLAARVRARWVVWENVPGVLSSGEGRDFGCILGGLAELGYGVAYRVLDAQFFGVPQRRRRVFVVGYLGDWRVAAAVLFERASLRGDSPPSRKAREEVAGTPGGGPGARGWADDLDRAGAFIPEKAHALACHMVKGGDPTTDNYIAHSLRADGFDASEDGTGRGTPLVTVPILEVGGGTSSSGAGPNGAGIGNDGDPMFTLQRGKQHAISVALRGREGGATAEVGDDHAHALRASSGGGDKPHVLAFSAKDHGADAGDQAPTLRAGGHTKSHANGGVMPAVAFQSKASSTNSFNTSEVAATLDKSKSDGMSTLHHAPVRRLTPRECERLQGFATCIERVIISVCFDPQNGSARAALKCLRSQSDALPVEDGASTGLAWSADATLWNDRESRAALVAAHVRIGFEPRVVAIRNHGRYRWSANGAAGASWFLPCTPPDAFARAIAEHARSLVTATPDGRAASPESTPVSLVRANGRWLAGMSGRESVERVSGADSAPTVATKSTTSKPGLDTLPCGLSAATSLCSALDATSLCIPEGTPLASTASFIIDIESDYTLIPFRGKPASDGPRYKALGNSMAVPVMAWIGRRIAAVSALPYRESRQAKGEVDEQ